MGYNKFIKSGNTLEIYSYDRNIQIFEGEKRGHKGRARLSSVAHGGVNPLSPQEFEGKRKDNATRASMAFRRLILSNLRGADVPVLLTCTYKENQADLKQGYKDFTSFIQALRYKFGTQFRYIAVPEFQKRGAVHFHALVWGLPESAIETERHTRLVAGLWGHGFIYLKMTDGNEKLSSYLAKYMAKSFIDYRLKNQKAYVCSRNLLRPQIYGGISSFGTDSLLEEFGVTTPEIDKTYDTHWLGKARHRIYKLSTENPPKNPPENLSCENIESKLTP